MKIDIETLEELNDELFSGPSLEVGTMFWHLQKARTEMDSKCWIESDGSRIPDTTKRELTLFGKEVNYNEIAWWVFKMESDVKTLLDQTELVISPLNKLKRDSTQLRDDYEPSSYQDIIKTINDFTEAHKEEIHMIYEYVQWLHSKDILAPSMLFSKAVWSNSPIERKRIEIPLADSEPGKETIRACTLEALGLRNKHHRTVLREVYGELHHRAFCSDSEKYDRGQNIIPLENAVPKTSRKVLTELAFFFEKIRGSVEQILLEIRRYNETEELLYRDSFWRAFISKALNSPIELQTWDFKETLSLWHSKGETEKEKSKVELCEDVAAFANSNGGVLIIGVTDERPRKIVGIPEEVLENRVKSLHSTLKKYLEYAGKLEVIKPISFKDGDCEKTCLVLVVAQTRNAIPVMDKDKKYKYPIRVSTGKELTSRTGIEESKRYMGVLEDNYNFIAQLNAFLYDQFT